MANQHVAASQVSKYEQPKKVDVTGAASVTDVCSQKDTKEKHVI